MTTHLSYSLSHRFIDLQELIKPNIYIEVGAFDAEFSKIIISKYPDANVWAFEASPYVYEKHSPITGINYVNKAVSDQIGFIEFELQKDTEPHAVNNSIMKRNENKDYDYILVESITLNSMFANFDNICLWVDCEGANREVLLGASDILPKVTSIFIEVEKVDYWKGQWLDQDVFAYLENFGFRLLDFDSQYENQYNCIFVKYE